MGFFLVIGFLLFGDVIAWWSGVRWLRRHGSGKAAIWAAHAFYGIQTIYMLVLVAAGVSGLSRHVMDWIPTWGQAVIYIWHIVFLPATLLMWLGVGALIIGKRLLALAGAARAPAPVPRTEEEPPVEAGGISRRSVLLASVAAIPPLVTIGTTGYSLSAGWQFRMSKLRLPVAGLPPALEGMRIAHVTDLHVGRWSTQSFLREVVEATNSLQADLVLFTGDLLDISIEQLPLAIDTIKRLRGRQGMYLIEGNHDLIDDAAGFRQAITHEGLNFLRGGRAFLEYRGTPVELMGIPWTRSESLMREDVMTLASGRDASAFPILLAHHPHAFDAATEAGLPLTLSGHTHGGQLALSREVNAGNMLFRYVSGLYQRANSKLLVSNGTGNWFPLRLGAPAEIIEITLARA